MQRPFGIAIAGGILAASVSLGQSGSLFDPEQARVNTPPPAASEQGGATAASATGEFQSAYPLLESHGPVLVRVASFSGDSNAQYAEALAKELRERYGMPSYVFRYQVKYTPEMSDEEAAKYKEQFGIAPRRWVPLSDPPANWTVLVGDFPSIEDRAAQKALANIRELPIQSVPERVWKQERIHHWEDAEAQDNSTKLERENFEDTANSMANLFKQFRQFKVEKKSHLSSAMLVRNPHPDAVRKPKQLSPETIKLLLEMNTSTPFSVYENKGAYTLVAAQFQGGMDVGDQKNSLLFSGGKIANEDRSPLAQAAKQAISLCEALRQLGVDAYVFHGQYASLVCVGGFPERFDVNAPEYRDPRVRARLMSQSPEVNAYRQRLATITLGGIQLAPYAELIVAPKPPPTVDRGLTN